MTAQARHIEKPNRLARITISDVSDALGLTKSTVSRAMNDYPDISDATRTRVKRMAEKMGYHPLSHAQAIKTGRTKSLGLVIQMADHDSQRPFLAEFLAGLSTNASQAGWTLTIAASDSAEATVDTFNDMIRNHKADGFVLPRTMVNDPRIAILRDNGVPFVLFGRTPDTEACAWFDVLGEDAMKDAVTHLASLGHNRIGFINGGMQYSYAPLRRAGFLQGMTDAGLTVDPDLMRENAVTIAEGAAHGRTLLSSPTPPTAIVCAVDMAALGVYRAAADFGLEIGKDVSVISYDGIPDGAHVSPQLTTFVADFRDAGERISALLIRRIKGEDPENLRETTEAAFLERGSTGTPRHMPADLARAITNHCNQDLS